MLFSTSLSDLRQRVRTLDPIGVLGLTNIVRAEPSPNLFQVPADYQLVERGIAFPDGGVRRGGARGDGGRGPRGGRQ